MKCYYDILSRCERSLPRIETLVDYRINYTAHYAELDFVETCGVDRNLIRISIGLEDPEDIWTDFEQALATASTFVTPEDTVWK